MFNYKIFAWLCTSTDEISSCYSYYGYATTPEWYDLSDKEYVTFDWTSSQTANITCIGSSGGTPSPTLTTPAPNTPVPTTQATDDDLCMWYRGETSSTSTNLNLNGLYQYQGTYSSRNYYSMTSGMLFVTFI